MLTELDGDHLTFYGCIALKPAIDEMEIDHYYAITKINKSWIIYDDLRGTPTSVGENSSHAIQLLLYIDKDAL